MSIRKKVFKKNLKKIAKILEQAGNLTKVSKDCYVCICDFTPDDNEMAKLESLGCIYNSGFDMYISSLENYKASRRKREAFKIEVTVLDDYETLQIIEVSYTNDLESMCIYGKFQFDRIMNRSSKKHNCYISILEFNHCTNSGFLQSIEILKRKMLPVIETKIKEKFPDYVIKI